MRKQEHTALKNGANERSRNADLSRGRDSSDSRTSAPSKGCAGAAPQAGEQSTGHGQEGSHRILTDGGEVVADSESDTSQADDLSFIISSQYRCAVVDALDEGAATPSTIAEEQSVGIAHVSRALQRMRERDLVELIVDEDRKKGRLYDLSADGAHLVEKFDAEIERNAGGGA
jgi:DNA-binding transcriptional ArsR family regulator